MLIFKLLFFYLKKDPEIHQCLIHENENEKIDTKKVVISGLYFYSAAFICEL